jgi:hypothetical protein
MDHISARVSTFGHLEPSEKTFFVCVEDLCNENGAQVYRKGTEKRAYVVRQTVHGDGVKYEEFPPHKMVIRIRSS